MFALGKSYELFKIFGFPVGIHPSWLIVLLLLSWSLAAGWFPSQFPGLGTGTYWALGVAGALGLFVSIVLHELAHSLVARRQGLPIRGITLFLFGGVARMEEEPSTPRLEFTMALAGPVASILIAFACMGLGSLGRTIGWPEPVVGVMEYLGLVNLVLVGFNVIPAFPLDGGRVLRSLLWQWKGNLAWATKVTSAIGAYFGAALVVLGVFSFMGGNLIGGIWFVLIGLFLREAARMGYQQLLMRQFLEGEAVRRFARDEVVTAPPDLSIREFVDEYVYRDHFKMYPVVDNGRLLGMITTRSLKDVPREEWDKVRVAELMTPPSDENTIAPDEDALAGLQRMGRTGESRLMVVSGGRLVGILTLKDLLELFRLKIELEED